MKTLVYCAIFLLASSAGAYDEVSTSSAAATAWSVLDPYAASNTLDGNFSTFWSNNRSTNPTADGAGNWYQVTWPVAVQVCYIRTEGRSYQGGFYSIPKVVRLHFSDGTYLDFNFADTTADHWVQEYYFDADQKTTTYVKVEFISYWHHVYEYIQYYEADFYYNPTALDRSTWGEIKALF
jgi:hypothetical protein